MHKMYDQAKNAYQQAVNKQPRNGEYRKGLQDAEFEYKKSRRKDYYKILDVKPSATPREIKKGFRKCGVRNHPAKCKEDEKEECVKRFHLCGEANDILSDEDLRRRYDRGEDVLEHM